MKVLLQLRGLGRRWMAAGAASLGLTLALSCVGCSFMLAPGSRNAAAIYDGPECEQVLYPMKVFRTVGDKDKEQPIIDDPSAEAQALLAVCGRRQYAGRRGRGELQAQKVRPVKVMDLYLEQEDYNLDVVRWAAAAILAPDPFKSGNYRKWPTHVNSVVSMLAQGIGSDELRAALVRTNLPDGAKSALLKNFQQLAAQAQQQQLSEAARDLFVNIPTTIFRQRQQHYTKHAAHYAELRKLSDNVEQDVSDEHVSSLRALRRRMLADCDMPFCQDMPLIAKATKALATLHVLRNERIDARAESFLFHTRGSYRSGLPQAVRVAQEVRLKRLREIYETYQRARKNGSSEAVADEIAGGRGANPHYNVLLKVKMELPNYALAIDKGAGRARTRSATVAAAGGTSVRLERYDKPILFPRADVKGLRPGDKLYYVTLDKEARTVKALRGDVLIHLRDAEVPPQKPAD